MAPTLVTKGWSHLSILNDIGHIDSRSDLNSLKIRVLSGPAEGRQSAETVHIFPVDLKIEDVFVLEHPFNRRGLGKGDDSVLIGKSQTDLSGGNIILLCKGEYKGIVEYPASSKRTPGLHENII